MMERACTCVGCSRSTQGGRRRHGAGPRPGRHRVRGPGRVWGWPAVIAGLVLATGGGVGSADAAEATAWSDVSAGAAHQLDHRRVDAAADAIAAELLRRADPEHGWDPARWSASHGSTYQDGGYSALVALALVRAGVPLQTPALQAVVDRLESMPMRGTYAVATRASLWAELPPRYAPRLAADVDALHQAFDVKRRGWNYAIDAPRGRRDHSIRQFATLALWDAEARGLPTPPALWASVEAAFIESQRADGGWNYTENNDPARGSMTAAAVATLIIAADRAAEARVHRRGRANRRTNPPDRTAARDQAIRRGVAWLDDAFDPTRNPGSGRWFSYYAYAIERVGLATGRVRFGGVDWFPALAATTIDRLCREDEDGTLLGRRDRRTVDMAFGLLLLSRGRVPLVAGKLVMPGAPSDGHPRDVAGVARAADRAMEADHGWIEVSATDPLDAWLRAPLLVSSGRDPLATIEDDESRPASPDAALMSTAAFRRTLGAFVDRGGVLLAVDRGNGRHRRSLERHLIAARPHLEVVRAPADHPVYRFHRATRRRPPVDLVRDGARAVAILVRGDDWLTPPANDREGAPPPEESVVLNCLLALTDDVPLRPRLAPARWPTDEQLAGTAPLASGDVHVLPHPRSWPGAEAAVRSFMARRSGGDHAAPDDGRDPGVLVVTGTHWSADESPPDMADVDALIDAMLAAADRRTVLVTTAGGHGDFSRVIEARLRERTGGRPMRGAMTEWLRGRSLNAGADDDPSDEGPNASPAPAPAAPPNARRDLRRVRFSADARRETGPRPAAPRLTRIDVPGSPAVTVVISHDDLLVAQFGRGQLARRGPVPDDATRLLERLATGPPNRSLNGGERQSPGDA